MNAISKNLLIILGLLSLTGCTQRQVQKIRHEVDTLNLQMRQLSQQSVKITQQNTLNANSDKGAYLLPGAKTSAQLKSLLGNLRLSLSNVEQDNNATLATLIVSSDSDTPLPAFSGKAEAGQIHGPFKNYRETGVQTQSFKAPLSSLVPGYVVIRLRFEGLTPAQIDFIRIHNIQPDDFSSRPASASPFYNR